jgi:hypothetical protein
VRDVQVFLAKVEKADGTVVDRFSPMNLKWTHTGETNRKVLLQDIPVFCAKTLPRTRAQPAFQNPC